MLMILSISIGVSSRGGTRVRSRRICGASTRRATRSSHIWQQKAVGFLHIIGSVLVQRHSHIAIGRVGDAGNKVAGRINRIGRIGRVCIRVEILIDHRLTVPGHGAVVRWWRAREVIDGHHRSIRRQTALEFVLWIVRKLDRGMLILVTASIMNAGANQRLRSVVAFAVSASPVDIILLILLLLLLLRLLVSLFREHVSRRLLFLVSLMQIVVIGRCRFTNIYLPLAVCSRTCITLPLMFPSLLLLLLMLLLLRMLMLMRMVMLMMLMLLMRLLLMALLLLMLYQLTHR